MKTSSLPLTPKLQPSLGVDFRPVDTTRWTSPDFTCSSRIHAATLSRSLNWFIGVLAKGSTSTVCPDAVLKLAAWFTRPATPAVGQVAPADAAAR